MKLIGRWRRRVVRIAALGAAMILMVTGSAFVAGFLEAEAKVIPQPDASSTGLSSNPSDPEYHSPEEGFSVRYPESWTRSKHTLTPNLVDPREILSLGTFELRTGGQNCAHFAEFAIGDMGPGDAFISIQEREGPLASPDVVDREARAITLEDGYETEARDCLDHPADFLDRLISFRDSGRWFHAYIALGSAVSAETLGEVEEILGSLRFEVAD